jgi:Asp-tRNA(Asn)/Glu-tRNA(Gln) amidotransferase B subunit
MIQEQKHICKSCALGTDKYGHNSDPKTCIKGREEFISHLSTKEQIQQLIIHERISTEMANFILSLSKERNKTPLEIIQEEGLNLLTNE